MQTGEVPARAEIMAPPLIIAVNMNGKGNILVNRSKRVLYIFDKDSVNTSACYNECAKRWPPLIVSSAETIPPNVSGAFGTIVRSDGGVQATHNGKPLYFYADDVFPGDMNGDGYGGFWHTIHVIE
jgi:predicted lipoprotein with Yx(FWY)xxD motif